METLLRPYQCKQNRDHSDDPTFEAKRCVKSEVPYAIMSRDSSLDGLPYEIRLAILQVMPELPCLQALTRASVSYRRVYRSALQSILTKVLLRDVHPELLFDLLSITKAMKLTRDYKLYVPELKCFFESYKAKSVVSSKVEELDITTVQLLAEVQLAVHHVTSEFCQSALSQHPITGKPVTSYKPISHREAYRIQRALYRYELFCILFHEPATFQAEVCAREVGKTVLALEQKEKRSLNSQDRSSMFLALFQPWEVEELACVHDFLVRRYTALLEECLCREPGFREQFKNTALWDEGSSWIQCTDRSKEELHCRRRHDMTDFYC